MTNQEVVRIPQKEIIEAASEFQTPFFVYEEDRIRKNCKKLKHAFGRQFRGFTPLYALKANMNPHVLTIIMSEGFGMDCSSEAEVWIARRLGSGGMYTGNYTTMDEFKYILEDKNIMLNLDDVSMVPTIVALGFPEFVSFRINPGISKGSMKSLLLAGKDAKYGVPKNKAIEAYRQAREAGAKRFGIHMMTGSNVLDENYFVETTKALLAIAGTVKKDLGIDFEYVNIGGGFGVPYRPEEKSLDIKKMANLIRTVFVRQCQKGHLKEPKLMIEPGRYIMADAGFLVTRVQSIKEAEKKFIGVDAGMNDLPRPAIYDAYHHITVLGKNGSAPREIVSVVGRLCENNDQFAHDRELPKMKVGDVLAIHNAGAHSFSMGHNYNGRPRAAEYLLTREGKFRQIRRAETINDLFKTIV